MNDLSQSTHEENGKCIARAGLQDVQRVNNLEEILVAEWNTFLSQSVAP